ncbi:Hypothetical predicted protein [Mytilus galloprovincialis]|uniref:Fibronectin type-III domain-containing protein n=1 Tax=Mytilus galloprovincialis TaxID=29158 RepID=A0A8B6C970_MYTGA|nr:Hypothetical predicted protein [Mytilus galloprovincialis]
MEEEKKSERLGKPYVTEENKSDHIILKWNTNRELDEEEFYQIKMKKLPGGYWKIFKTTYPCIIGIVCVSGLKAKTSYVLKVRVANDNTGEEGSFSSESDVITTANSPAFKMMMMSKKTKKCFPASLSQTKWITCYTLCNDVTKRIAYTIKLIDTPGFEDTCDLHEDPTIVTLIRDLIMAKYDAEAVIRERQKLKNAILNFPEEIDVYFSKLIHEEQKVNILKKYPDKHDKFEYEDEKSKKKMSEENLLKDIHFEIQKLEIGMQIKVDVITEYGKRLKEIALRPDCLSTVQYIELMTESENRERKSGFDNRVKILNQLKKRADIGTC